MTPEEELKVFLTETIGSLWNQLEQELRLAADADKEHDSLVGCMRVIDSHLEKVSSVKFINETHKAGTEKLREFVSDSQRAIDYFNRPAPEGNTIFSCVRNIFSCVRNYFIRRNFAKQAKKAKEKLKTGLNNLKMAVDALQALDQLSGVHAQSSSATDHAQSSSATYPSWSIAYIEERSKQLVGIEEPRSRLFGWLTEDHSKSKVIFVHGAPGIGKTALVEAVLGYRDMRQHFKFYVWIEDLRSCELTKAALMEAYARMWDLNKIDNQGVRVKLEEVFKLMREDKALKDKASRWALVLDDASKAAVFKSLVQDLFDTSPSVLVTTRISSLASSSEKCLRILQGPSSGSRRPYDFHDFKHAVLSSTDSYKLFCQQMPDCANLSEDDSIFKKCGGLPLAILAMCEHLIYTQRCYNAPQFDEWPKWSGSLQFSSLSKYEEDGPIRRMTSMNHLHSSCVSYLSIFRPDCPLRCSTLMRLWMAEGFPETGRNSDGRKAMEILTDLVDRNFFQEVKKTSYGKFSTCRVNNLLHQIMISREKVWPYNIKRLSFHGTIPKVDRMTVSKLFSLHVFNGENEDPINKLLGQVKSLEVLDLQTLLTKVEKDCYQYSLKSFPDKILSSKKLTYLSLRDTKVRNIPDKIGDLENLETLDLKGTKVVELPKGIWKLKQLRHLLVYRSDRRLATCTDLNRGVTVNARSKLGELTSLQKLCMIDLGPVECKRLRNKTRRLLKEIEKLTLLQRLGISMLRSKDVECLSFCIGKLINLEALRLIAAPDEKIDFSKKDEMEVLRNLKRVHLRGCLVSFSQWIGSLAGVVKLVLKGSELNGDALQHLGKLGFLRHLELEQAFDNETTVVTFEAGGFKQLHFLRLKCLQSIEVKEEALPTLETLSLVQCKSLKTVENTCFSKLKCLKLYNLEGHFTVVKEDIRERIAVQDFVWEEGCVENDLRARNERCNGR